MSKLADNKISVPAVAAAASAADVIAAKPSEREKDKKSGRRLVLEMVQGLLAQLRESGNGEVAVAAAAEEAQVTRRLALLMQSEAAA